MRSPPPQLRRFLPALSWAAGYRRADLPDDLTAGVITAVLLIPQGMAYALLAGLPAEYGLYASILPALLYALFGTSRALAVGPVAVAALLVGDALTRAGFDPGTDAYLTAAATLSALSALLLLGAGILRLGVLVNYLSHPVLTGFTSAAAVLIILSQLGPMLGAPVPRGEDPLAMLWALVTTAGEWNPETAVLGLASLAALAAGRHPLQRGLIRLGLSARSASLATRVAPLIVVLTATLAVAVLGLAARGVSIVGEIPAGLPALGLVPGIGESWRDLLPAALLISVIGYVESVSVARVLAQRRRQKVDANQELTALGLANAAAALSGTMPVAGGFSRSMVNFAAGARTQLAALVTAALVAASLALLAPVFQSIPKAVLAAVIIVSVSPLIDLRAALDTWRFDRAELASLAVTFAGVLSISLEGGLVAGLAISILVHLWRTGRPHVAVVGRIPGTEHFRNAERHRVELWPTLLLLRVDESLYFPNTAYLEQIVAGAVADRPRVRHLVLICSAVNRIDYSAVETLEGLSDDLRDAGVTLHLAELKGPVMDRLRNTRFLQELPPGRIFLTTNEAVRCLADR